MSDPRAAPLPRADAAEPRDAAAAASDDLRRLIAAVDALAEAAEPEAWLRPGPRAGWSAVECLEHLSATAEDASRRLLAARDRAGRRLRRGGPRWWVRLFARSMEPPARFRTRTRAGFRPVGTPGVEEAMERFRRAHRDLADDLAAVDPADLHRVVIDSPFGPVSYTPLEWGLVLAAHGRRHVWQAERALRG